MSDKPTNVLRLLVVISAFFLVLGTGLVLAVLAVAGVLASALEITLGVGP